ncbi:ElyC/SanA/YdcF family protein [Cytophagaceae bacterium ABcell3]|nr:ElyC/SanA/YdcF family protein [Cytophagaceae bacterium ABcell3]
MRKNLKKLLKGLTIMVLLVVLGAASINIWMLAKTEGRVYTNINEIPENDVALVLGTSKYNRSGRVNLFFKSRMEAAAALYHSGKVKHIIVSGDNSLSYYNEPQDMKKALLAKNVPVSAITLDYAGFRTFDSIVRSKKVFGRSKLTIVTQSFHCNRALFISDFYGLNAIAFSAEGVKANYTRVMQAREFFARCKAVSDLYFFNHQPKFLGDKVKIVIEPPVPLDSVKVIEVKDDSSLDLKKALP